MICHEMIHHVMKFHMAVCFTALLRQNSFSVEISLYDFENPCVGRVLWKA